MKKLVSLFLLLALVGCGGGGSDSSTPDETYFAGSYNGSGTLISNTCPADAPDNNYMSALVNQDSERIMMDLVTASGRHLSAEAVQLSSDTIQASYSYNDGNCLVEDSVSLSSITNQSGTMRFEMHLVCGPISCNAVWQGYVTRT